MPATVKKPTVTKRGKMRKRTSAKEKFGMRSHGSGAKAGNVESQR